MNCRATYHPRVDPDHKITLQIKSPQQLPARQSEKNYERPRENSSFNDECIKGKGNTASYLHKRTESQWREDSLVQLRNAEKLKHFQQLKASNIDDLNIKIQRMISKLSDEVSPSSSFISNHPSKLRVKTDYSDLSSTHLGDSHHNDSQLTLDFFFPKDKKTMMESEIVKQSHVFQERRVNDNARNQADAIRKKYKIAPEQQKGRETRHEKCMSGLNNFSQVEDTPYPMPLDADLIRFRQKLKENNEKQRRQLSRQLNFRPNASPIQKLTIKPKEKQHRNIEEQLSKYQQRLNSYNSKKLICLAKEGQIERIPLGDRTNNNNSYLKYSPYANKSPLHDHEPLQLKIRREEHFEPTIEDFDQNEQPLTADFRQPSDKNQLKLLLKNLSNQISLDEQFRNCKKWFDRLSLASKWEDLAEQVHMSGLDLDETSIHEIFCLKQQEQNPFYTPRESEFNCHRLVQLFIRCEQHWFQNVVKKYNRQRLLGCGFRESKLDIAGKGYLAIEDFVRFLNLQMDLQIRNRDLLIIFQRLKSEEQLSFNELVEVICQ